jgi:hypothetical protein
MLLTQLTQDIPQPNAVSLLRRTPHFFDSMLSHKYSDQIDKARAMPVLLAGLQTFCYNKQA